MSRIFGSIQAVDPPVEPPVQLGSTQRRPPVNEFARKVNRFMGMGLPNSAQILKGGSRILPPRSKLWGGPRAPSPKSKLWVGRR